MCGIFLGHEELFNWDWSFFCIVNIHRLTPPRMCGMTPGNLACCWIVIASTVNESGNGSESTGIRLTFELTHWLMVRDFVYGSFCASCVFQTVLSKTTIAWWPQWLTQSGWPTRGPQLCDDWDCASVIPSDLSWLVVTNWWSGHQGDPSLVRVATWLHSTYCLCHLWWFGVSTAPNHKLRNPKSLYIRKINPWKSGKVEGIHLLQRRKSAKSKRFDKAPRRCRRQKALETHISGWPFGWPSWWLRQETKSNNGQLPRII